VGEKCSDRFRLRIRLPRNSRDLLHAANLRHGTDGFTSPPKEGVLTIFSPLKIRRLRSGLNPRTWVPKASTLPLDHRSRSGRIMSIKKSNDAIGNRTRDLPACSSVPQPTAPPAACSQIIQSNRKLGRWSRGVLPLVV